MKIQKSKERVYKAFAHQAPDRTPLFEIFTPFHPIHWDICGRTIATDHAVYWDALSGGVSWEELVEEEAQARFEITKFFELDICYIKKNYRRDGLPRPKKKGKKRWSWKGRDYAWNEETKRVEKARYSDVDAYSKRYSETSLRKAIEKWDGAIERILPEQTAVFQRVRELAKKDGLDWSYLTELDAGTAVAFYPPFQLMWLITEPDLLRRWMRMRVAEGFHLTEVMINAGCDIIAMGGDVSCDKGPILSPAHYREFILPVIKEHIDFIHRHGAFAVYTSDGNHWAIKEDFFFNSGADGYKEVDKAAGMTFARLIEEGVAEKLCIMGNVDARYTLCRGTADEVRNEVIQCLKLGQRSPGGHILHSSHSVHADTIIENYYTMVNAYREFFGMDPIRKIR